MKDSSLLTLMDLFYDGILSPDGWTGALEELARMTSSGAVSLVLWNRRTDQALVGDQVGLPAELTTAYAEHFHQLDPARPFMDRIAIGDWYLDERELGVRAMRRLPFYQDFLRVYDLDSTMASPFLRAENGLDGFLSLSGAAGRKGLPDVARSLARLMPHIQRAARLRIRLLDLAQQSELHTHILDRFDFPIVAVTADKAVMSANRLGGEWLSSPGNPLASGSPYAEKIARLLKAACGIGGARTASGLAVRKPSGAEYYLTAVPLPIRSGAAWTGTTPMALLLVNDPERAKPQAGELLRQIFHFTPAEVRLIGPLLQGSTLQEACSHLKISIDTGRTHLKAIFGKLGIRRQADIFRVLGNMEIVDYG